MITFKDLPDTTTPLNAANLNGNFNELQTQISNINSNRHAIIFSNIEENSDIGEKNIGTHTIPEDGIYLICGYYRPNYYMKTDRQLDLLIYLNNYSVFNLIQIINGAYTMTHSFCVTADLKKDDVISFAINNLSAEPYAVNSGIAHFIKLK